MPDSADSTLFDFPVDFTLGGLDRLTPDTPLFTVGSFEGGPTNYQEAFSTPSLGQAKQPTDVFKGVADFGVSIAEGLGAITEGIQGVTENASDIAKDISVIKSQTAGIKEDTSTEELARVRAQAENNARFGLGNIGGVVLIGGAVALLVWAMK